MPLPDHRAHVAAIRSEGRALGAAAAVAGLAASVPPCPGWDVETLVRHVGHLHRWVTRLGERRPAPEGFGLWSEVVEPDGAALLDWFGGGVEELADEVAALGPDAEVWSWTPRRTSGFWARRMAHETAMHRVDTDLAAGRAPVLDADLAADGIDELFWLSEVSERRRMTGAGERLHVHCTDVDGEWLVELGADGPVVRRQHEKGDAALRGAASDLLLALSGRIGLAAVDVLGDATLVDRCLEQLRH